MQSAIGMWIRNCWYVIAWDHEISPADSNALFTRTVLDEPILVMRTGSDRFIALEDRGQLPGRLRIDASVEVRRIECEHFSGQPEARDGRLRDGDLRLCSSCSSLTCCATR